MPQLTYLEAVRQGIWEEMDRDPSGFCLGEDIGIYGGAFKVTDRFIDRLGPSRVTDTPIPATQPLALSSTKNLRTAASRAKSPPKTSSSPSARRTSSAKAATSASLLMLPWFIPRWKPQTF